MNVEDLIIRIKNKIIEGESLIKSAADVKNVDGIEKLKKKIKQEINFLLKVTKSKEAKKEHLICTNLHHFQALVSCLKSCDDPIAVLQYFILTNADGSSKRICVDIIAEKGHKWIKVIARNPKALSQLSVGDGEFGQRSIIDHAMEYLLCSHQHPHLFTCPKVVFEFSCGIQKTLSDRLDFVGITVSGRILEDHDLTSQEPCGSDSDDELQTSFQKKCTNITTFKSDTVTDGNQKLNLDVTAMLAYVSSLTNGRSNFEFKEPILTQQAEWERMRPVKPILDQLFHGKYLLCCQSAMRDFKSIVSTLGGPGEVFRAKELLSLVSVVPNMTSIRAEAKLKLGGKIKERSLTVFSTGDAMKAITVTANEGFVRAAKNQGVEFAVFIHESRALTEGKEHDAKLLDLPCSSSELQLNSVPHVS